MEKYRILDILKDVESGKLTSSEALVRLKLEPFEDLGYAKIDHHRALRQGVAEVIYGASKTPEQICGIVSAMRKAGQETILITRMSREAAALVSKEHTLDYHDIGHVGIVGRLPEKSGRTWHECDVNYQGGYRGSDRLLYSTDGLIYYTEDHYNTFTQLY